MEFIRKYIHVAKLVKPILTQEASDHIAEEYARLRSHDQANSESARVSQGSTTNIFAKELLLIFGVFFYILVYIS